jgi:hypothetical protein
MVCWIEMGAREGHDKRILVMEKLISAVVH